jgi:hypothetical protein
MLAIFHVVDESRFVKRIALRGAAAATAARRPAGRAAQDQKLERCPEALG